MGLNVSVGIIADLGTDDPEGVEHFDACFDYVGELLKQSGLPQHVEPRDCEPWGAQMHGYSGLHLLRRVAAHLDAGLPLPPPGDESSPDDPVLAAYFDDVTGKRPGFLRRIFERSPRFTRKFDHLIVHGDGEGFYLPQDFPKVLIADDQKLPGGMLGSAPRLLAELERIAEVLGIPESLHAHSEALAEAAGTQGDGEARWEKYGIESYSCVVLREACRMSITAGAAIVFT